MKKLLITRLLPEANLAAARARYDVTLRDSAQGLTVAEATAALRAYDAILPTLGDQFTKDTFAGDIRCGVLANFGVGYNHIDAQIILMRMPLKRLALPCPTHLMLSLMQRQTSE